MSKLDKDNSVEVNESIKKKRSRNIKKWTLIISGSVVTSLGLAFFALTWQASYTLLAYTNAFYFSGFILFFISWMILMSNMNILSPMIYGLKTFFMMFVAKKQKLDYYEYLEEKKENPIPRIILLTPLLTAIPNLIIAIILHLML